MLFTDKIAFICLLIAMLIVWFVTPKVLPLLKRLHFGQAIREEGPKSHYKKAGTPTMGGLIIIGAVIIAQVIGMVVLGSFDVFPIVVTVLFCALGFWDDFIKVKKKHNLGLRAWQKMAIQLILSLGITLYAGLCPDIGTAFYVPILGEFVDFGFWFYPITFIAVVALTNAVNLTDGLDGLAAGVSVVTMIFFFYAALYFDGSGVSATFSGAIIGACLGFLRHNSNPASLFMGDTGSMALGGAIIFVAIMTRTTLFVLIAGFVFVMEAISVVMQVGYFKLTHGKRIFRMAPIHHHFELKGWAETRVVTVFWAAAAFCVAIAFLAF